MAETAVNFYVAYNGPAAASYNAAGNSRTEWRVRLGRDGDKDHQAIVWEGVVIPQGVTILSAEVNVFARTGYGYTSGTLSKTRWFGRASDNAPYYSSTAGNRPGDAPRTSSYVDHDRVVASWTVGDTIHSKFDVTSIVQEIINRPGWASGNSLAVLAVNNGSADGNYVGGYGADTSGGGASAHPPELNVTYTTDAPSTTGQIKVFDGSTFVPKPVKVWNGTEWVTKPVKRWDGSNWVETNY
ncbi:hypothetical protein [Rhodococcus sp. HS-D2]|uniref:hypothetical protein n=1 Tax=Rhodococcus sp. HS-D2 TaxID=1384636 RepID=UPI0012E843D6|nr:hypothetical protein [Rhodococcus sp. HS-D2]